MIYKSPSKIAGYMQITFQLPADLWADKVNVVGDFNRWDHTRHAFLQSRDGNWRLTIDLPTNRKYRFLYWIDGDLTPEFKADDFVTEGDERQYSVLDTMTMPVSTSSGCSSAA